MGEWLSMFLKDLINRYKQERDQSPSNVNDLLDYTQRCYIQGEISIKEYKQLFFELDKNHAEKPQSYFVKTYPYEIVNKPS
jgi:REP element-mobilizing transposase RayT